MLDVKALKAEIVRNGYTQASLAKELGMTDKTLCSRLKTGDFGTKEIEILIDVLHLEDPISIFFCKSVT